MTDIAQTAKEEKVEQKFFATKVQEPVVDTKPKVDKPVKTAQDEFNVKLNALSKKVLELLHGTGSDRADQIEKRVHDTIKHAHTVRYNTAEIVVDPDGGFRVH